MTDRTTDEPLLNPELDLLGLSPHAEMLAELIRTVPTPFTIGVYGEWGAGKTTFAYFVKHYLDATKTRASAEVPVEFIRFEAWPHKTADELWRALIIRIAKQIYHQPVEPPEQAAKGDSSKPAPPSRQSWRDWLTADAITLGKPETKETDESKYHALLARLDRTLYGGIGKSRAARWQLDQEQVLVSAVKAGLSALGTASPIVAGIRGLFNLDAGAASGAAQREQNEATRARIESIDEFREVLKDLLGPPDNDRRICIFLDDLDRCNPDIALDLLDAIKVFLVGAKFVFVVAADEEIIGRGLRLRYSELAELNASDGSGTIADRLAREGQQYFEKIVQLRIHIPEANPQTAHRFIAAQFPEWMPATDIIFAALGSNPRRIKQYCNWMMFRHSVDRLQTPKLPGMTRPVVAPIDADDDAALLNKLIALYSRSESCLRAIAALAAGPGYAATMTTIEKHLDELGEDPEQKRLQERVADPRLQGLCKDICDAAPLFTLFREPKRFSEFDPLKVETFAAIADMRPRAETVLEASDRVFMRILQLTKTATITTRTLVVDEFSRLRTLDVKAPDLLPKLRELAKSAGLAWTSKMLQIEAQLQSGKIEDDFDEEMKAVIAAINKIPTGPDGSAGRRALLLKSPRLSDMLREVVMAYCSVRTDVSKAKGLLSKRVAQQASEDQKTLRLATYAYEKLERDTPAEMANIEKRIGLRKWAATHCLWMRSFAKLNALDRCWPDVARKLRRDFGALRAFENEVASKGTIEPQYAPLWETYKNNDQLRSFLALQPLFGHIDPTQLQNYLVLSQAVAPAADTTTPAVLSTEKGAREPSEFINLRLRFKPTERQDSGDATKYQVEFQMDDEAVEKAEVSLNWKDIDEQHNVLRQRVDPQAGGPTREGFASAEISKSLVKQLASIGDYTALLREVGGSTFNSIFPGTIREKVDTLLSKDQRYRLIFEGPNEVMSLPFETLYSRKLRSFLALSQRYSLVRWGKSGTEKLRLPLTLPLRILVVLANPSDTPPLNLEGEAQVLARAMEPAIGAGRVVMTVLGRGDATWSNLRATVKSFRPHVLHFVGHGVFDAQKKDGAKVGSILLEGADGKAFFLAAPEFAALLGDEQIQIAVLNGCDTGTAARNEAISSMADALTNSGVPAVIATMREVIDDAALLFTREFYRALCEGEPLEVALAEARKALSVERRDWSVYALFASMVTLDVLKIPAPVQERGNKVS